MGPLPGCLVKLPDSPFLCGAQVLDLISHFRYLLLQPLRVGRCGVTRTGVRVGQCRGTQVENKGK